MRTLYLIRHAKSSWDNPGLRDFSRPLNERGLREAPKMAQMLFSHGVKPDLLVSSPAKRAITTALFFAEKFGVPDEAVQRVEGIYEASERELLRIISALPDAAACICLFGHNNTLTDVANLFSDDFIENIPTCGIVRIESKAERWDGFYEGNSRVTACWFPKEVL
jgi:phosphohistidine phosphatase